MSSGLSQIETVIEPTGGWRSLNWGELFRYRDLFFFLAWRDVKAAYAQSVLGIGWAMMRPLAVLAVFTIVFGRLARMPSHGVPYPVFFYSALVPWMYFSLSLTRSSESLVAKSAIWSKVYFPRLLIPMIPIAAGMIDFVISLVVLALMTAWYGIAPSLDLLVLPLLSLILMMTAAAGGLWLSAMSVQYRDVRYATQFLIQLLLYAAPVIWPISLIDQHFPNHAETVRLVYGLFPMAGVIEGFRAAVTHGTPMPWDLIAVGGASALVLFFTGALYFRRNERHFADVV